MVGGLTVAGAHILRAASRIMLSHGEVMVLARGSEATTVSLKGKRIPGSTEDVGGSASQQRFRVKIAPTELAASAWVSKVPAYGDTIAVAGVPRAVMDVRPLSVGNSVALYELDVVG